MTVVTTTSRIVYTGNDIADVFAYNFKIFADSDLVVTEEVIATGVQTVLVLTTDYTVSGAGVASGGNVTLVAGALPSTKKLIIERNVPQTQAVDLEENSPSPAAVTETVYDKLTMLTQQVQDVLDRAMRLGISITGVSAELPTPVADKVLVWASDALSLTNQTLSQTDTGGIADSAITTAKLADLAVTTAKLAALAVIAAKIATNAVTADKILALAVTTAKINNLAVTVGKLGNDAVETAKIKDLNVTAGKLAVGVTDVNVKVGAFTRNTGDATGDQEITGVGFQPETVEIIATVSGTVHASWGYSDLTTHKTVFSNAGGTPDNFGVEDFIIRDTQSGAITYTGTVSAVGADGFTIAWIRTGAASGTLTCQYRAMK